MTFAYELHNFEDDSTSDALRKMVHQFSPPRRGPVFESHEYGTVESEVWRAHLAQRVFRDRTQFWTTQRTRELVKWSLTFLVGACTALVGLFITFFTKLLTAAKFAALAQMVAKEKAGEAFTGAAFLTYVTIQVAFVFLASLAVYVEPLSAGSGIPEIKCFLNGINIPRVVRIKTLMCKALGVLFSVAGGLPAGKEGPMIHSGAVVAAGISQGKSSALGFDTSWTRLQDFRCDKEKRDFVACGAAAGVCAAFGAPIGGVLFSLEEGASFWSTRLTWRAFFCGMMGIFTLYWVRATLSLWGRTSSTEMFSFGQFTSLDDGQLNFSVWECVVFILIGCMGGLIGAMFNGLNRRLSLWRMRHIATKEVKVIEALCVAALMSVISFVVPLAWSTCTRLPDDLEEYSEQQKDLVQQLVPFYCDPDTEYNEVATLFLSGGEGAIRQLFHAPDRGLKDHSTFSSGALFLFFAPYVAMACLTYGVAVPSGLFVPSLLSGAAFGRLCGHLLHKLDNDQGTFADSGTYALIGAASVLGGMARMTISLAVILLEATGDMQYVLPLMLALLCARWVGNCFNDGLYDIHIHLKRMPFLEAEPSEAVHPYHMTADTIMSKDTECLRPFEKVGTVVDLLRDCEHQCFPVIDDDGVLHGTVLRKHLTMLLQTKAFTPPEAHHSKTRTTQGTGPTSDAPRDNGVTDSDHGVEHARGGGSSSPLHGGDDTGACVAPIVHYAVLESIYPRFPDIHHVGVSLAERAFWMDLRPYMDTGPPIVSATTSVHRTYTMFRTLGLRHLCVVNQRHQLAGIITRDNLLEANLEYHCLHEQEMLDERPRDRLDS